MVMRVTKAQQAGDMPDDEFASWFCHSLLKVERPDFWIDLGPDICRTYTLNGRLYARHFGFTRPDVQAQYIMLMWQLAPNLHEVPGFAAILQSGLDQDAKVEALYSVDDAVADEAMARCDMIHWTPEEVPGNILGLEVEDLSDLYGDFPWLAPGHPRGDAER